MSIHHNTRVSVPYLMTALAGALLASSAAVNGDDAGNKPLNPSIPAPAIPAPAIQGKQIDAPRAPLNGYGKALQKPSLNTGKQLETPDRDGKVGAIRRRPGR